MFANDLKQEDFKVVSLHPGFVATDMGANASSLMSDIRPGRVTSFIASIPCMYSFVCCLPAAPHLQAATVAAVSEPHQACAHAPACSIGTKMPDALLCVLCKMLENGLIETRLAHSGCACMS